MGIMTLCRGGGVRSQVPSRPRSRSPSSLCCRSWRCMVLMLVLVLLRAGACAAGLDGGVNNGVALVVEEEKKTTAPIIGIFAQPSHAAHPACGGACEYIAASYVKWVESAGGRCVPIPYNASVPALETLFGRINGLLLPGGGNPLPDAARYMIGRALKANDAGDYFPVWGTCLGMEWLLQALAGDGFALDTALDAWNISLPLEFTSDAAESRLFRLMDPALFEAAGIRPLTMNNHHKGASPRQLQGDARLAAAFAILSTNQDRAGRPFVSTVEARGGLPVWGVQWHPEKPVFEWGTVPDPATGLPLPYEAIDHEPRAQELARYTANFFIQHARRSGHAFPSAAEEAAALMYNYAAVPSGPGFVQSYYFHFDDERGGVGAMQELPAAAAPTLLRGARIQF